MPLSEDGLSLFITGEGEVNELQDMPSSVARIIIQNCTRPQFRIPTLPAHVKELGLVGVQIRAPLILAEGLEVLTMSRVDTDVPLTHWIFPASLKMTKIAYWGELILDLRAVTSPAITLWDLRHDGDRLLLPESLASLVVESTVIDSIKLFFPDRLEDVPVQARGAIPQHRAIFLPPYLEAISLVGISDLGLAGKSRTTKLKDVSIRQMHNTPDLVRFFPRLESLYLGNVAPRAFPSLKLEHLRQLTLNQSSTRDPIVIDAPELETLHIISGDYPSQRVKISEESSIGGTLVELTLEHVQEFPPIEDWNRLEVLTVTDSEIELPKIQWLRELEVDKPLLANGIRVNDLDEYKQAWGATGRAKRA